MKNILFVVFTFFMGLQLMAQNKVNSDEDEIYVLTHQKALPKEGMEKFYEDFKSKFKYDKSKTKKGTFLRIGFVVEKDGSFSDIKVIGEDKGLGKEAIRVLMSMPKWNPAMYDNKVVRSRYTLPINFGKSNTKKNKSSNLKFKENSIDKMVLETLIEEKDYEFKCNCSFLNKHTNSKIQQTAVSYTLNDFEGAYSIIIQSNPKKKDIPDFDELMNYEGLAGEKKFIELDGIKAFQISNDSESPEKGYNTFILLISDNKLINIQVNTEHKILTEYLVDDLKKTFKLKI